MSHVCRHCRKGKANRPRGLCWTCYYTPGLRDLYPSTSKFGRAAIGGGARVRFYAPMPARPTSAPGGSPEKLDVLSKRALAGEALFHPADSPRLMHRPRPAGHFQRKEKRCARS
jgi:hypothetical protein